MLELALERSVRVVGGDGASCRCRRQSGSVDWHDGSKEQWWRIERIMERSVQATTWRDAHTMTRYPHTYCGLLAASTKYATRSPAQGRKRSSVWSEVLVLVLVLVVVVLVRVIITG